jgi:hypothetical protein
MRLDSSLDGVDWVQPIFMSAIIGEWLDNDANRSVRRRPSSPVPTRSR